VANDPTPEKLTIRKPLGGGQDPHSVVTPIKKKIKLIHNGDIRSVC
jgi:hypothetical protein